MAKTSFQKNAEIKKWIEDSHRRILTHTPYLNLRAAIIHIVLVILEEKNDTRRNTQIFQSKGIDQVDG